MGSAPYCEVRLPFAEAAAEHVAIEDRGSAGIYVEALALSPAPTINGVPFSVAPLGPEDVLEISGSRLRVSVVTATPATFAAQTQKKKTSPLAYVAAIVGFPLALSQISFGNGEEELGLQSKPPALFGAAEVSCTQRETDSARALAVEELGVANAKRERRPFHAHDGVQGVAHYRIAAACYRVAADEPNALDASKQAADLQRELGESYRTHRVRLEHALSIKDYLLARKEVRALLDLTQGLSGDYVTWLSNLERRLKLRETKPQ